MLTNAQLVTLKAAILADPTLSSKVMNSDGDLAIADLLNLPFSPPFTVWKTNVTNEQIVSSADAVEVVGLTTAKLTAYQCLLWSNGVNPSKANVRNGFDQVFSAAGGVITRAALLILWKRLAKYGEKIFATGTGTDAVPALLTFEGNISGIEVGQARNLP